MHVPRDKCPFLTVIPFFLTWVVNMSALARMCTGITVIIWEVRNILITQCCICSGHENGAGPSTESTEDGSGAVAGTLPRPRNSIKRKKTAHFL